MRALYPGSDSAPLSIASTTTWSLFQQWKNDTLGNFNAPDLADDDKDGAVTLAEMDAARDAIGERPEFSSEKLIEAADADHDGKLTLGEWVAASNARFARFDTDKDDALTLAEWQAGIAAEMPLAQPAPDTAKR